MMANRERTASTGRILGVLLVLLLLTTGCRQERIEGDPLTETNLPRPTNEVAEKIPGVTNPPPR